MHRTRSRTKDGSKPSFANRAGGVLVIALVCLALVSMILLSVFKLALGQRHQVRIETRQVQAELLAESGLSKAVAQLRKDEQYDGEEWIIQNEPSFNDKAKVTIKVDRNDDSSAIRVQARIPAEGPNFSQASTSLLIPGKVESKNSESEDDNKPKVDQESRKQSEPENEPANENAANENPKPADEPAKEKSKQN